MTDYSRLLSKSNILNNTVIADRQYNIIIVTAGLFILWREMYTVLILT